ncbi:MAG: DUF2382 domain-containing protein [Hymenobacter sp.]|nr:MAG: DUF2382 domain-containing protein [Hymenobacter sp.]
MQPNEPTQPLDDAQSVVIPVIAESFRIEKQTVETGRVVLHKTVHVDSQTVEVPLREEQVQVQRIAVNRYVEEAPPVRHEGETMIIPIVREEVVVTKRLLLIEELHVHKQVLTTQTSQIVELRREEVTYERTATPPTPAASELAD